MITGWPHCNQKSSMYDDLSKFFENPVTNFTLFSLPPYSPQINHNTLKLKQISDSASANNVANALAQR